MGIEIFDKKLLEAIIKTINSQELDVSEQDVFDKWIKNEDNRTWLSNYKRQRVSNHDFKEDEAWTHIKKTVAPNSGRNVWLTISSIAAVALLCLGGLWLYRNNSETSNTKTSGIQVSEIYPGTSKAKLIFDSGDEVNLSINKDLSYSVDSNVVFTNVDSTLKIEMTYADDIPVTYQTMEVPIGGEYKVVLSDGTSVWLNSGSSLKFPNAFVLNAPREVELKGEAYFSVSKQDGLLPFIVSTGDIKIKVLGTKFDVKSYPDDDIILTSLEEGSVRIINQQTKKDVVLKPDQLMKYSKTSGLIEVEDADASLYKSWKDGRFVFENERLEEIMKQLGRWYDINVVYKYDKIKEYRFTGNVDRFDDIMELLNLIAKTYDIDFEIVNRTIFVK